MISQTKSECGLTKQAISPNLSSNPSFFNFVLFLSSLALLENSSRIYLIRVFKLI